MTEPHTAATAVNIGAPTVGALFVWAGPEIGPWLSVLACSLIGSLWTLSLARTGGDKMLAIALLVRINLTACVLTAAVVYPVVSHTSIPTDYALPATALTLGAIGRYYDGLFTAAARRARRIIGGG